MSKAETSDPRATLKSLMTAYERRLIVAALGAAAGNQRRAARELGLLPTTLNEKMKRLGIRRRVSVHRDDPGEERAGSHTDAGREVGQGASRPDRVSDPVA